MEKNMEKNITMNRPDQLQLTEIELCGWLGHASPGDRLEYHRGFLALDCASGAARCSERERAELLRVTRRAFLAAENGLVHLLQRRHGPDDYSYMIEARLRQKGERRSVLAILAEQAAPAAT